jgi:hypothetical protein
MMNQGYIKNRIRLAIERDAGTEVTVCWTTWSGGAATDPVTGGYAESGEDHSETVKALVHEVNATTSIRQHAEVEVGDLMLDFTGTVDWSDRENVRFVVNGKTYVQKQIGSRLATALGTWVGGVNLMQTVVLRPAL